jgi:predicted porin
MKKISALLAAGALLGATSVNADPTVFGSVEQVIQHVDNGSSTYWDMYETGSNYIGFKASEDLGNGTSAFYLMYFRLGSETNTITQWDNYVGIKGNFGKVRFGRMNSLTKQLGEDFSNKFQIGNTLLDSEVWNRNNNAVQWVSPSVNGFTVGAEVAMDGSSGKSGFDQLEYMVGYKNGPIELRAAFRDDKAGNDKGTAYGLKAQASKDLTLAAAWNEVKTDGGAGDAGWSVMADYKVSNNNFRIGQQDSIRDRNLTTAEVEHFFSKTTSVFLTHQISSPESGAADTKTTGLGMRMKF